MEVFAVKTSTLLQQPFNIILQLDRKLVLSGCIHIYLLGATGSQRPETARKRERERGSQREAGNKHLPTDKLTGVKTLCKTVPKGRSRKFCIIGMLLESLRSFLTQQTRGGSNKKFYFDGNLIKTRQERGKRKSCQCRAFCTDYRTSSKHTSAKYFQQGLILSTIAYIMSFWFTWNLVLIFESSLDVLGYTLDFISLYSFYVWPPAWWINSRLYSSTRPYLTCVVQLWPMCWILGILFSRIMPYSFPVLVSTFISRNEEVAEGPMASF